MIMIPHPANRIDKVSSSNYANETNFQFVQFDKLDDVKRTPDVNDSAACSPNRQRIVIKLRQ